MKSKLTFLLALLALTAVFVSPALAVTTDFTSPAGGSTISTPTNVVVQTATPVAGVEILDGSMASLGLATSGDGLTWTFLLDPALHPNGSLFLNARSTDGLGGQELASPALLVTIAKTPDVTWVGPANAQIRYATKLEITTDGTATNVQFSFRGSALIGTITESPADTYTMSFDPDDYPNGPGDLRADVTNGNGTTPETYGVDIDNLSAAPSWNAPTESSTIPGSAGGLLQAGTSIEYDGVEFFFDGVSVGQAVEEGAADSNDWRLRFDSSSYSLGAHQLSAVATNGTLTSAPAVINVTLVDDTDPAVASYSPVTGSSVAGSVDFSISTSDNVGATSATYSLDGSTFLPMVSGGAGVFSVEDVDVSALPNGTTFFYVEVADAAGNTTPGSVGLAVSNPVAPTLAIDDLEFFGSTQVGSAGMTASGATATGNPAPAVDYSWRVCDSTPSCNSYAGQSYSPIAGDVGRTVELVVRASNGVSPQDVEIISVGSVAAADSAPSPTPTPTPTTTPPTPATPPVVITPPVVVPPAVAPTVTTIVNTSSAPQTVVGTAGADRIVTGSGYDVIRAGAGNDVISPGKGGGFVYAGSGNDIVRALSSKDLVVSCGTGKDTLFANQTTRSVGCERIVVASNNKLVTVKAGADKRPVMPANFNGPYALAAKLPAVIAADRKVAAATAVLVKRKAAVALVVKKDAVAVKAVAVAKPVLVTAVTSAAAAEKQLVVAEKDLASTKAQLIAALQAKKGVAEAQAAIDLATKNLVAEKLSATTAAKTAAVASAKTVAATKTVVETKTDVLAAVTQQRTAAGRVANTTRASLLATRTVAVAASTERTRAEIQLAAAEKRRRETWSDLYAALKGRPHTHTTQDVIDARAADELAKKHVTWAKQDVEMERLRATQAASRLAMDQQMYARALAVQAGAAAEAEAARGRALAAQQAYGTASARHQTFVGGKTVRP